MSVSETHVLFVFYFTHTIGDLIPVDLPVLVQENSLCRT